MSLLTNLLSNKSSFLGLHLNFCLVLLIMFATPSTLNFGQLMLTESENINLLQIEIVFVSLKKMYSLRITFAFM